MNKLKTINKLAMEISDYQERSGRSLSKSDLNAQRIVVLAQPESTSQKVNGMIKELECMAVKSSRLQGRSSLMEYHQLQHQLVVATEALNVVESIVRGKELDEIW